MNKPNRMRRSNGEKRQIFSIRKFKFGAASALLGLSLLAGGQALADEVTAPEAATSAETATYTIPVSTTSEQADTAATTGESSNQSEASVSEVPEVTSTETALTGTTSVEAPVSNPKNQVASQPQATSQKAVANDTSADVQMDKVTNRAVNVSAKISTTVTEPVHRGDYIDYTFKNLPLPSSLNKKDLVTEDGKVVGQMSILDWADDAATLQNNSSANDSQQKQSLSTDTVFSIAKLRVTFNEIAENLSDIKYNISYLNQPINVLDANKNYDMTSTILVNDKEIKTSTTEIPATTLTKLSTSSYYASNLSTARLASDGKQLEPGSLDFVLNVSKTKPLSAGTQLQFSLSEESPISFDATKLKVGDKVSQYSYRNYTDETAVNPNGIILNLRQQFNATVDYVSDKTVTVTLNSDLTDTNVYGISFGNKFLITDYSKLDLDNKILSGINSEVVFYNDDKTIITNSSSKDGYLPVSAANISAEAKQIATLTVRYIDQNGKELTTSQHSTGVVGDHYDTKALEFDGYRLVDTPTNASGQLSTGETVVTYTYHQLVGTVLERNITKDGKVLSEKTLVENAPIGTAYDTSDQEAELTVDGVTYQLVQKGENSVGSVTEGQTVITNVYEQKPETPKDTPTDVIPVCYVYYYIPITISYYYYEPVYYSYDYYYKQSTCYDYYYSYSYARSYNYHQRYTRNACSQYVIDHYYTDYTSYNSCYTYRFC